MGDAWDNPGVMGSVAEKATPSRDLYTVTEVRYERVFRLGEFESMRIGLSAQPKPGETLGTVIRAMDSDICAIRNGEDGQVVF